MLKINRSLAAFLMAAAFLASCKKGGDNPTVSENLKLQITANDWDGNKTEFKDGEIVGVYANKGTNLIGERFLNNETFTKKGSLFEASREIPVPDEATVFSVYKPYDSQVIGNDTDEKSVSVNANQSSITDYVNSDFIMGVAVHNGDGAKELPVEIKRMFSNISVSINTGENTELDLTGADITFKMNTMAKVNFSNASITETSDQKEIIPKGSLKYNDGKYEGVSLIVVPQQLQVAEQFIHIVLDGEETLVSADELLDFKSGMKYELEFTVEKLGIDYSLEFTVTEEPWTLGNDVDEVLDIESNEIESVIDIDGNVYDVVKIGKQFWTASNLITTRYNDGTEISFLAGNAEWQNATYTGEGGYTYYQLNEANIAKYGMYYNYFAAASEKLCPKGWRVPSQEDLRMLIEELGGAADAHVALKATSGWQDEEYQEMPEYQGTNTSGMNIVPAGYKLDGGEFKNQKEFAYLWSRTPSEYRAFALVLASLNKETLLDYDFHRAIGMSVRCVKY